MAGIGVQEIKSVKITTTDGQNVKKDDLIVIGIKGQDVVCRFIELDKNGYFVTQPIVVNGSEPVKYRINSIAFCYQMKTFEINKKAVVAECADQERLESTAE